jgi:hypothetical protein
VHYSSTEATSESCVCNLAKNQRFILNQAGGDHSQSLWIAYEILQDEQKPKSNAGIWNLPLSEKQIPISIVGRSVTIELMLVGDGVPSVSFGKGTLPLNKLTDPNKLSDYGWYLSDTSCNNTEEGE